MSKKNGGEGKKPKPPGKINAENEQHISEYAAALIPQGAIIDFVFYEDFNGDGMKEAIVGFTRYTPFPPESAVFLIYKVQKGIEHCWLSETDGSFTSENCGTYDNAVVADTDGDGRPELVLSKVFGHEHDISVFIFDWVDQGMKLAWRSERNFFHGSMVVEDIYNGETAGIVIESGTHTGHEIIEMKEACYHVREGWAYRWNGKEYIETAHQVRMPYESYNLAVDFLKALWSKDYRNAFEMVLMPGFLGLKGLEDSSLAAFKSHIAGEIRPVLLHNLSKGKLIPTEPYDTCCQFLGPEDCFTVELVRVKSSMKVCSLGMAKRSG